MITKTLAASVRSSAETNAMLAAAKSAPAKRWGVVGRQGRFPADGRRKSNRKTVPTVVKTPRHATVVHASASTVRTIRASGLITTTPIAQSVMPRRCSRSPCLDKPSHIL
jgi:hypothetical protein